METDNKPADKLDPPASLVPAKPKADLVIKPAWYWLKDASGEKSVTVTLVFVSFWATTIAYLLSMFGKIGPVDIKSFDVSACSAYMIPILMLYFGRKATDAKFSATTPNDKA